jgi:predicted nucleic acid-binding Zn finger protein
MYALDLIDRKTIKRHECPAGRYFYQITNPNRSYRILSGSPSCTCPYFVQEENEDFCQHILAVWIAEAMGEYEILNISDEEYADSFQI